jgi:hypothetical protein
MKEIKYDELRVQVLLSTYKAMLGMISPNVRLISIAWDNSYFKICAYFDRPVIDEDYDILKSISTEVASNFPEMNDITEYAEYSLEPIVQLKPLSEMVFLRYGELEI